MVERQTPAEFVLRPITEEGKEDVFLFTHS